MSNEYQFARQVVAEREASTFEGAATATIATMRLLTSLGHAPAHWSAGVNDQREISWETDSLVNYMRSIDVMRRAHKPAVCALSAGDITLILERSQLPNRALVSVRFGLPAYIATIGPALELVHSVCGAFGAFHGHVEDLQLLLLYQSERAANRAWQATPPELRQHLPGVYEHRAIASIPALLVPDEYDRRLVPAGVWWANYWDPVQTDTVGRARLEAVTRPFFEAVEDQGSLFGTSANVLDVESPEDQNHLRQVVSKLHIRELQESHRYS